MEHRKIINLLSNTNNQISKFWAKNWVEVNDESHGRYSTGGEIKCKATMLTVRTITWYTVEVSKQIKTLLIRKCLMLIVVWIAETYLEP